MTKAVQRAWEQLLRTSGIRRTSAAPRDPVGTRLEVVQRSRERGQELVGHLWCEEGEYVFRYEPSYEGPLIPEFPSRDHPCKSEVLWPFFEVRKPPTSRKDVQDVMSRVNADDPLEVLAALGGISVTNPYELRVAGEGAGS